jgi:hypothetical protein
VALRICIHIYRYIYTYICIYMYTYISGRPGAAGCRQGRGGARGCTHARVTARLRRAPAAREATPTRTRRCAAADCAAAQCHVGGAALHLQQDAAGCGRLQRTAGRCNGLRCAATDCHVLQQMVMRCNRPCKLCCSNAAALRCDRCNRLQRSVVCCNRLPCVATSGTAAQPVVLRCCDTRCTATMLVALR